MDAHAPDGGQCDNTEGDNFIWKEEKRMPNMTLKSSQINSNLLFCKLCYTIQFGDSRKQIAVIGLRPLPINEHNYIELRLKHHRCSAECK